MIEFEKKNTYVVNNILDLQIKFKSQFFVPFCFNIFLLFNLFQFIETPFELRYHHHHHEKFHILFQMNEKKNAGNIEIFIYL